MTNCRICGAPLPPDAMFCGECGSSTSATPESRRRPEGGRDTSIITPLVGGGPPPSPLSVPAAPRGSEGSARVVIRFSTGETAEVAGSGLIGRRPVTQPSEHVDHLVQIVDPGLSVSKTHLEFGLHEGALWVSDRYSGNGTSIHRPDGAVVRCEPGRRYLVPHGARVDIGEQFFVVE